MLPQTRSSQGSLFSVLEFIKAQLAEKSEPHAYQHNDLMARQIVLTVCEIRFTRLLTGRAEVGSSNTKKRVYRLNNLFTEHNFK